MPNPPVSCEINFWKLINLKIESIFVAFVRLLQNFYFYLVKKKTNSWTKIFNNQSSKNKVVIPLQQIMGFITACMKETTIYQFGYLFEHYYSFCKNVIVIIGIHLSLIILFSKLRTKIRNFWYEKLRNDREMIMGFRG